MTKSLIIAFLLLFSIASRSQSNEPKIGSEKGVKEKLMLIKKGLPDIRKNLTTKDEVFENERVVKFEMGDGLVIYEEYDDTDFDIDEDDTKVNKDKIQELRIRYSKAYFSGAFSEYQNYYIKLISLIKEIFGTAYSFQESKEKNKWQTVFFQKNKSIFTTDITISVTCSMIFEDLGPSIDIEFHSKVK